MVAITHCRMRFVLVFFRRLRRGVQPRRLGAQRTGGGGKPRRQHRRALG